MENIPEITLAYAAGLIDGEGTITLSRRRKGYRFRSPVISMSSTTIELVEFMKSTFGGSISSHKTYQLHHKKSYSWKIVDNTAVKLSELLLPFLREPEKRRRAELIAHDYKLATTKNGKYNPDKLAAKVFFEQTFFHPSTPSVETGGVPISL